MRTNKSNEMQFEGTLILFYSFIDIPALNPIQKNCFLTANSRSKKV